ncbi:MAG: transposase [Chthoniobacterales bacterium]|nr:transposase [Chthoniobacterales bacterium]
MAWAKVISGFEVLSGDEVGRRRAWTDEEKIRIVADSLQGYRQGSATARRLGISRSLLTRWRADYRAGRLGPTAPTFMAVSLAASAATSVREEPPRMVVGPVVEATIEVVLGNARRMIVPVSIDPAVLARLLPIVDAS